MNSWRRRPIMQTQASRYVFPALGALYERCQRFAYPILRVAFGLWFIPHGCQKLFGWWGGNIGGAVKGVAAAGNQARMRSEEHTSEPQSQSNIVCRLLLEKKNHVFLTLPSHTSTREDN